MTQSIVAMSTPEPAFKTWKTYPSYRVLGHAFLNSIPSHWTLVPFRRLISHIEQGWSPQASQHRASEEEWAVLKVGAVLQGRFRPEEHKALLSETQPEQRFEVRKGDLLMTRGNTPNLVADVCLVPCVRPRLMMSDLHYRISLDDRKVSKRTVCYWFLSQAGRQQIEADAHGTSNSMVKVSQSQIRSWEVAFPPIDEQQAITSFLDYATAKIDKLIDKKHVLIDLLLEKRSALVSRVVTRGIPSAVAGVKSMCEPPVLKPSAISWLEEIPQHWGVKRLKFLCDVQTGDKDTVDAVDGGAYPFFVRSQTVERLDSFSFDCEAVLTAGDGVGVGKVFHHFTGRFAFHQRVYMLNRFRDVTGRFLYFLLSEQFYKVALEGNAKSTVDSLRMPLLLNFSIPLPPISEQRAITEYIDQEVWKLDELVRVVGAGIERLQQYRSTLIDSAITGQIDVRNYRLEVPCH